MSTKDIAAEIGLSPNMLWQLDKQQKFANNYTIAQIENALLSLSEYDRRRKGIQGSALSFKAILTEMVLKIIS